MTTDVHHPLPMGDREYLSPPSLRERMASLKRARSHSKLVRGLRYALPVLAVGIFGLYFLSPEIQVSIGDMEASVSGVVIEKGNLRMVKPKLEGVNDKQGAYTVTAKYAEQAVSNPDFIHLTGLSAEIDNPGKGWSRLTAPKGTFETKTEKLELMGDIRVAQSGGMRARLTRADVDMKSQLVVSNEPVKVDFTNGKLDSRTMRLDMDAKRVGFNGDVRVRLEQKDEKSGAEQAPADATNGFTAALKSDAPIDIAAPKLTIFDAEKLAWFQGGVVTDQDGSRMTSTELKVYYSGGSTTEGGGNQAGTKLKWIDATGDVRIATRDGRKASAETLTYDALKQELTLDQNVVLSQNDNILRGKRMISDLETSITRFPPLGRVKGHFEPANAGPVKDTPAQTPVASGGTHIDLSSTKGQPIDIEADSLTVNDKEQVAMFHGKVNAVQGTMTMRSTKLNVNYSGDGAATDGAQAGGSKVTSIRAEGKVLINTADDQATTSDWAVFDAKSQTVTIGGNVVLSQGDNVIKGDQLVIDLTTNRSRFVNQGDPSTRKRVRGLFMPKQSGTQ